MQCVSSSLCLSMCICYQSCLRCTVCVQVLIRRGELLTGCLDKKSLGPVGGGLVHVTWMEHGPDATRRLINNIQVRSVGALVPCGPLCCLRAAKV